MALTLPTEKSGISKKWEDQKTLMIGPGKIGKSEFWSHADKALFLETEPGLNHLNVYKVPVRGWADFRDVYGELVKAAQAGKFPYDTIVVDTLDRLMLLLHEEVVRRGKEKFSKQADQINSIGDVPNGVGWFWTDQMIDLLLSKIEDLPAHIVFIGHVQTKRIQEPGMQDYDKDTINIGGKAGGRVLHWPDHIMNVRARMMGAEMERVVRTKPSQSFEAGSRGNIIPDNWKWVASGAENFKKFRGLFD